MENPINLRIEMTNEWLMMIAESEPEEVLLAFED